MSTSVSICFVDWGQFSRSRLRQLVEQLSGPDPIVDDTTTSELVNNASVNIGGSLDTALNGVSRVTSGSMGSDGFTEDPAESGIGGLWSNDAQSLVDTSLNLGNEENTIREGSRITICLLYTSPSPRDKRQSRMPSSA